MKPFDLKTLPQDTINIINTLLKPSGYTLEEIAAQKASEAVDEEYLSYRDISKMLKVSKRTIQRMNERGLV